MTIRGAVAAVLAVLVVIAMAAEAAAAPSVSARLAEHLASKARDRAVRRDVLRWHKTMSNGCVAYASTALRHVGVAIDERGVLEGDGVSRLTRGFVRYLEDELGWQRVTEARALRAGDLVFTTDAPCCPDYPAHVYVFHRWHGRDGARRRVAVISDNNGHRRSRPLDATGDVDGFAFALRAPD